MSTDEKVNFPQTKLQKAAGTTDSERYLTRLCNHTFLSLWSYSNVYRKQGHVNSCKNGGDGKELCDLLVLFENHIIIFSDKDCEFPDGEDIRLRWCRWYRRAIKKSADQISGAERWIKEYPNQIFLDRSCAIPFPLPIPSKENLIIHRIVVAHGASRECAKQYGGSGSLMLLPSLIGEMHADKDNCLPFAIGQINPQTGYTHIFDDVTLDLILSALDTITDFVRYINKKEELIGSGRLISAAGEEELLAHYLKHIGPDKEHTFYPDNIPKDGMMAITEGIWDRFINSDARHRQVIEDKVSYTWDALIEKFVHHITSGTSFKLSHPDIETQEKLLRFLARECRVRRRLLSNAIFGILKKTTGNSHLGIRYISPSQKGDPYYIFLICPRAKDTPEEVYRQKRFKLLEDYLYFTKLNFPEAVDIIGLATEAWPSEDRSEDLQYFDARQWDPEQEKYAIDLKKEYSDNGFIFGKRTMYHGVVNEYPDKIPSTIHVGMKGNERNLPCPCGSGKKFKKCCGAKL